MGFFLAAEPLESSANRRARESEVRNSLYDFLLLPHMEEGRFEFPSRVTQSLPWPGWSVSARNSSYSGQHLSLGSHAKEGASCLQKESLRD